MSYLLVQILVCLLIAGLIGLIIGWLLRGGCSGKLEENDKHWNLQLDDKNNEWQNRVQGLMLEKKRDVNEVQNRLSLITKSLKSSEESNRLLLLEKEKLVNGLKETIESLESRLFDGKKEAETNKLKCNQQLRKTEDSWKRKVTILMNDASDRKAQSDKVLGELKEEVTKAQDEVNVTKLKYNQQLKSTEEKWKREVDNLRNNLSSSKVQADRALLKLKNQLLKVEEESKVGKEALENSMSKLQERENSWQNKVQGLISQESQSKAKRDRELAELKELLIKAEDNVKVNQEALDKSNSEWIIKLQKREKEIQSLISQESESKAKRDRELAELKEQLIKAEDNVKSNQELHNKLKSSEEEWILKIKLLEKQISREKNEVEVSKNKLFSSNNEFNRNLAKAQQAHRNREAQQKEIIISLQQKIALLEKEKDKNGEIDNLKNQLTKAQLEVRVKQEALDKNNSAWSLKFKNREKELKESSIQELDSLRKSLSVSNIEVKEIEPKLIEKALELKDEEKELDLSKKVNENESKKSLSFNLKRNSHKTKAKGRHIQRTKKKNIHKEVNRDSTKLSSTKVIKDNLQLIRGIGKVLESALHEMNIYTFEEIASWDDKKVLTINNSFSFSGRIEREEWVKQAKALASGQKTEFSERVKNGEVPNKRQE